VALADEHKVGPCWSHPKKYSDKVVKT